MPRAALLVVGLAACVGCGGGDDAPRDRPAVTPPPATRPAASPEPEFGKPVTVSAQANIFGAGRVEPPSPGGGGGGELPPVWSLPKGTKTVSFRSITGSITGLVGGIAEHGPEGTHTVTSNVDSFEGISGVIHKRRADYLVGVFLTDEPPGSKAPPRLEVTDGERRDSVAPRIGQTFYVGTGKGLRVKVPAKATRLFLGIAGARSGRGMGATGPPGFYANNRGELEVTLEIERR